MASPRGSCGDDLEVPMETNYLEAALKSTSLVGANQESAPSLAGQSSTLDHGQWRRDVLPGNQVEESHVVRQAIQMGLPRHLVAQSLQRRLRSHGASYTNIRELVSDLFNPSKSLSKRDPEVPMETDQLEDGLILNEVPARKALRMGLPPHLILEKVRAKILSTGTSYTDVSELIADVRRG